MGDPRQNSFILSPKKRALLKILREEKGLLAKNQHRIPVCDPSKPVPLTHGQEGLWFLSVLETAGVAYSVPLVYRLTGALRIEQLTESINRIIDRHEILRTQFEHLEGEIVQVISSASKFNLPVLDLSGLAASDRQERINQLIVEDVQKQFDLAHGPLLRGTLFRESVECYTLYLAFHHIILDEWSLEKLILELEENYRATLDGQTPVLPDMPVQYRDFASWSRKQVDSGKFAGQLDFWKKYLQDSQVVLELPADFKRPDVLSFQGKTVKREIPAELADSLRDLCREEGVTSFVLYLAVFIILLGKYARSLDILVGTPVANRSFYDVQNLIGYFLNTLVIRSRLDGEMPFSHFLQQVKNSFLDAIENQDFPFEKLVRTLNPNREAGIHPLFQVMFVLQNQSAFDLRLEGVQAEFRSIDFGWSKFDLTLFVMEKDTGAQLKAEYRTDLFEQETMERLLKHVEILLREVVLDRHRRLQEFQMLDERERAGITIWNDTGVAYPENARLHQLFEEQVDRIPEAVAVEFEGRQLTYRELNQQANQLAAFLRAKGVSKGHVVGLYAERSVELMICLLGILKAGAAVLPLDPAYPRRRLEFMCADAAISAVISQPSLLPGLDFLREDVLLFPFESQMLAGYPIDNPAYEGGGESLLYILYTSGSTGTPKGVRMPHRPLVNLLTWQNSQPFLAKTPANVLQYTPMNFDVFFQEVFSTWAAGAKLILVGEEVRLDFDRLLNYLVDHRIHRLFLPFVALQALAEVATHRSRFPVELKDVITAGEQLRITHDIRDFFRHLPICRLHNHYGPTEAHVVSTYILEGDPSTWPTLPPVGKPVANTKIFILDPFLQQIPLGLPGEIYLAGACLAHGYQNQPGLTDERFLTHSIDGETVRLYKTGDLGRYTADGNIEFLGRVDQQVKIRGFRVEPGEIESVLADIPSVSQAAVITRTTQAGEIRLEAFVVPAHPGQFSLEELRAELRAQLPVYMLPSALHVREALPLTASGKVDRRLLETAAPVTVSSPADAGRLQARDELEYQLCKIWERILETEAVGIQDSFFDLGGHSLLAVRLFMEIEEVLDIKLPVASLFQAPTVAQQAAMIRERRIPPDTSSIVPLQMHGTKPPFFCIHNFGGFVINYEPLSQALGTDQPFYGVQAFGLEGVNEPQTSIAEMAQYYLRAIQQIQPAGPYFLGGYCFGGVVAYQVASLLETQGQEVGLLALIDAYAPSHAQDHSSGRLGRLTAAVKNLPFWLRDFRQLNPQERRVVVNRRLKRSLVSLRGRLGKPVQVTARDLIGDHANVTSAPDHLQRLMEIHMLALMNFTPPRYEGRVTLFRIQRLPLFTHYDQDLGWSQCAAGGVDLHIIPGAHHNALMPPFVQGLADELRRSLEQAYRRSSS